MAEMLPLFDGDEVPLRYPDGTWIPRGLVFMLAHQNKITLSEARRIMIAWWGGKGNRAQRRQRKKR